MDDFKDLAMNNRVCLNPNIKWHGAPRVFVKDAIRFDIIFDKETGNMKIKFSAMLRKMSRKRLVKMLMAHGLLPMSAKRLAEACNRKGLTNAETYLFTIRRMNEFIIKNSVSQEQN